MSVRLPRLLSRVRQRYFGTDISSYGFNRYGTYPGIGWRPRCPGCLFPNPSPIPELKSIAPLRAAQSPGEFLLRDQGKPLDVIYLLVDVGKTLDNTPVLHSQILDWIRVQSEHGIRIGLVAAAGDEEHFHKSITPALDASGVKHKIIPGGNLPSVMVRSVRAVRALRREQGGRHVYVRGIWGAVAHALAFPWGGPELIYDFRGDGVSESEYHGGGSIRRSILDRLVRFSLWRASNIICVSHGASDVLIDRYNKQAMAVIPSCVDLDRIGLSSKVRVDTRKALGVRATDVVIAYAGGTSRYQQIPEMLRAWRSLNEDGDLKFLLLINGTPTPDGSVPKEDDTPDGTVIRQGLSRAEVASYLMAADIGFMLRESHPLNSVASPVKFAEYLSTGLAVVTSPDLGDVSSLVADRSLGVLVDPNDGSDIVNKSRELISKVRANPEAHRQRSNEAVRDRLDWKAYLDTWSSLLGLSDSQGQNP